MYDRIRGVRDDDLLVLLDADEIPSREVLLFLKLYDGYPQPVALVLRWSVFGYFWKRFEEGEEQVTNIVAAAPLKMIRELYANKIMSMRRHHVWEEPIAPHLSDSMYRFQRWDIGKVGFYSGHHCSVIESNQSNQTHQNWSGFILMITKCRSILLVVLPTGRYPIETDVSPERR